MLLSSEVALVSVLARDCTTVADPGTMVALRSTEDLLVSLASCSSSSRCFWWCFSSFSLERPNLNLLESFQEYMVGQEEEY